MKNLWLKTIHSDNTKLFMTPETPILGKKVEVKIRVKNNTEVKKIILQRKYNGETVLRQSSESYIRKDFRYYVFELEVNEPVIQYRFIIETNEKLYFYNQVGIFDYYTLDCFDFKIIADQYMPKWVRQSVFYQIFPDRFYNGNKDNDVQDGQFIYDGHKSQKKDWNAPLEPYEKTGNLNFYGGDLEGITEKIEYLQELGVTALYLTPIFEAPSSHKYDCTDFEQVDPHFGGNKALQELVENLHKKGMKIILDISINHTGITHSWFKEHPEYYGKKVNGETEFWCGVKTLPVLSYENQELHDVIYKNEDSILKRYVKEPFYIDGWRFDVGHNVGRLNGYQGYQALWRNIRTNLKEQNKELYLMAEHWGDASEYLQGDMWDGTMNYFGFYRPITKYFDVKDVAYTWQMEYSLPKKDTANRCKTEIVQYYGRIPGQLQDYLLNSLSSHDVMRLGDFTKEETFISAMILQFLFKGTPCVYYGEENGLEGVKSFTEGNRVPMEWDLGKANAKIRNIYKKMIELRKTNPVLQEGSFVVLDSPDHLAYLRFDDELAFLYVDMIPGETVLDLCVLPIIEKIDLIFGENISYQLEKDKIYLQSKTKQPVLLQMNIG